MLERLAWSKIVIYLRDDTALSIPYTQWIYPHYLRQLSSSLSRSLSLQDQVEGMQGHLQGAMAEGVWVTVMQVWTDIIGENQVESNFLICDKQPTYVCQIQKQQSQIWCIGQ